jgi:hypothetical protein
LCHNELDEFLKLIHVVQSDKLQLGDGHRGMVAEYIEKMKSLQLMENYIWIKELQFSQQEFCVRRRSAEADLKCLYDRYKNLMLQAENVLSSDFVSTVRHYSSSEQISNFFDFILNRFVAEDENEDSEEAGDEDSDSDDEEANVELFISKDTIARLEHISAWFLQREEQYELYDEKNEHCDINRKLRFGEVRNEFLKSCLLAYFKSHSVGNKSRKDNKMSKQQLNINKLVKNSLANSREANANNSGDSASQVTIYYSYCSRDKKRFLINW